LRRNLCLFPLASLFQGERLLHLHLEYESGLEFSDDCFNAMVLDDHLLVMAFDLLVRPFLDLFGKSEEDFALFPRLLVSKLVQVLLEKLNIKFILFSGPPILVYFLRRFALFERNPLLNFISNL